MSRDPYTQISSKLDDLYRKFRQSPPSIPDRLFHYTNPQGFVSIINSQRLWASNADFLNDSSEPGYALDLLKEALDGIESNLSPISATRRALNGFWDWAMKERLEQGPHLYVFCLSEVPDLLSQWRAYGAHGAGYAIGFSSSRLTALIRSSEGQYLSKVVYDRDQQKSEAADVFNQIVAVIENYEACHGVIDGTTCGADAELVERAVRTIFLSEIIRLRAKFKISAFHEEAEWRMLQFVHPAVDRPAIGFRAALNGITPYLELDLGTNSLPIEQVTIGPALKPELSLQSAMLILAKKGCSTAEVRNSVVPFRL